MNHVRNVTTMFTTNKVVWNVKRMVFCKTPYGFNVFLLPTRNALFCNTTASVLIHIKAKFLDNCVRRRLSLSTELKLKNRDLEKVYHTFANHGNEIGKLNHECRRY